MAAGGGDLEGALGALLALDVLEIDERVGCFAHLRLRAGEHLRAAEMVRELDQRGAGPGGFGAARGGVDEPFAARVGADCGRQHASHRGDRAVEAEFAQHCKTRQRVGRKGADRRHQAQRNRQIVVAAFLRQVSGSEIDRDAARGQRQAGGD